MATYIQDVTFNGSAGAAELAEITAGAGVHSDATLTSLNNASLTIGGNRVFVTPNLVGTTANEGDNGLIVNNGTLNITSDTAPQTEASWEGFVSLTNFTINKYSDNAVVVGKFGPAHRGRMLVDGLVVFGEGNGEVIFHNGEATDNSTLNGLQLTGRSTAQLNVKIPSFGLVTSAFGSDQASTANTLYGIRAVHQPFADLPTANVVDNTLPQEYGVHTATDVSGLISVATNTLQLNRDAALWLVNPIELTTNLDISGHITNFPGSNGRPAEVRKMFGYNQIFRDSVELTNVGGVRIYTPANNPMNIIPAAIDPTAPPAQSNNVSIDNTTTGVWIQQQYEFYDDCLLYTSPSPRDS